jgi:hypothetical protein
MSKIPTPDFWLVKIDETDKWCDSLKSKVKRIWGIYLIDVTQHTYCCEMTPSYWCDFVESYPQHFAETSTDEQDKLNEEIGDEGDRGGSDNSMYIRVSDFTNRKPLDQLPRSRKFHISRKGNRRLEVLAAREMRKALGEEEMKEAYETLREALLEYVHSNSLL